MPSEPSLCPLSDREIELTFEELITYQRKRVLDHARRLNPRVTDDDIQSSIDIPELRASAAWNYEDGVLAGYLSAQTAFRARMKAR